MTSEELKHFIHAIEAGTDGMRTAVMLMDKVKRGEVKAEEIYAHYKSEAMPKINAMVSAFGRGQLFLAQKQTWEQWKSGDKQHTDYETANSFRALCDLAQISVPRALEHFICRRVLRNAAARKRIMDERGEENIRLRWVAENTKEGWTWR